MKYSDLFLFFSISIIIGAFLFFKVPLDNESEEIIINDVEIYGYVSKFPDERKDKTILTVKSEEMDKIFRVTTDNLDVYSYGDILEIRGDIKSPKNFSDFNWEGYLAKEKIDYLIYNPSIEKNGVRKKNFFSYMQIVRRDAEKKIKESLLPPHSSLYLALLLGDKREFTEDETLKLSKAGLSHIVAISGMHIALYFIVFFYIFLYSGLSRYASGATSLVFLIFFILMIGAPASAIRAGIMVFVLILSQFLGRPNNKWRALLLAAAIMVAFNPYIVRYDIGFQLSFTAVLGILILSERVEKIMVRFIEKVHTFLTIQNAREFNKIIKK